MNTAETLRALFAYCKAENWAGHDPYDALNSPLLDPDRGWAPKLVRLAATQFMKRSALDFRPLMRTPKTQNAKALALNLETVHWLQASRLVDTTGLADYFVGRLKAMRSPGQENWCWGYSFPWQTRGTCVPRHSPNLVCTTFVADALLSQYERTRAPDLLEMVESAAHYIANDLYYEGPGVASFSYPSPGLSSTVHNANLMAAAFLLRLNAQRPDARMAERARKAADYSVGKQRADGSWLYGEAASQNWIDNFHTGYNLGAIRTIARLLDTSRYDGALDRGFAFYRAHFLRADGAARYFHDNTFPIDAHCVAQTILTMLDFSDQDADAEAQALGAFDWAVKHMWDARGYFHYRVTRFGSIRTSYMRWTQSWMLLAVARLAARHGAALQVSNAA